MSSRAKGESPTLLLQSNQQIEADPGSERPGLAEPPAENFNPFALGAEDVQHLGDQKVPQMDATSNF